MNTAASTTVVCTCELVPRFVALHNAAGRDTVVCLPCKFLRTRLTYAGKPEKRLSFHTLGDVLSFLQYIYQW